jgi:hypothetical protein
MSSKCFEPEGLSSGGQLYIQWYYGTVTFCIYNLLPEDELSGFKHVNDIRNIKILIKEIVHIA